MKFVFSKRTRFIETCVRLRSRNSKPSAFKKRKPPSRPRTARATRRATVKSVVSRLML
jgi:hypothetical protein